MTPDTTEKGQRFLDDNTSGGNPPQQDGEVRARASVVVRCGHFIFLFRDYLFPLTFVLFLLTTTPMYPFGSEWWDQRMDVVGILIAVLGQAYRLLAAGGAENIRRRGQAGRIGAAQVIRQGVFAHSRNPLYLGNLLIVCGFVVIANNVWWYVFVLPIFIAVYVAIILAEEEFLLQRFGSSYADYCRTVNRFMPQWRGLRQSLAAVAFDWRRALRREYGNMCSWGLMIFVLLIWERWGRFGYVARKGEIHALFGMLVLVLVIYVSLRWGKSQGLLRS